MNDQIKVAVSGACGKMGREVVKAVLGAADMALLGLCDIVPCPLPDTDLPVEVNMGEMLGRVRPDVLVDFTSPKAVMENIRMAFAHNVRPVVGTTGITPENLEEIRGLSRSSGIGALIAPNFAIGAVLMMKFASEAAKHMPAVEIIELHHDKKLDAPSGTAIKTAEMIAAARGGDSGFRIPNPESRIPDSELSARGGEFHGTRIHSVRLPGLVAHQEVIFGGLGQTLTIRHDSLDRQSFMPGVLIAIRHVVKDNQVIYGLDKIL